MESRLQHPIAVNSEAIASNYPIDESKREELLKIADKLKGAIMNHVDKNDMRDMFTDLVNPFTNNDEVICLHVENVLSRLREREKVMIMQQIIELVYRCRLDEVNTAEIYEKTIDRILYHLIEKDIFNEGHVLASLVQTSDYTLRSSLSKTKWQFVSDRWKNMGSKGIRHLFKNILSFIQNLPAVLSPAQKRQLVPVENLLCEILDLVPPIFTMTELYQFKGNIYLHAFPRVVERCAQIKTYCRPLADLVFVVGRSFMFPILAHPLFQSLSASWKVDKTLTLLFSRMTYLPNRKEFSSEQVYLFQMIMKQPRGKETLNVILKNVTKSHNPRTFDSIVTMLINETMAAVENLPPNKEIPRYQWDHLLSIVIYMAQFEFPALSNVIKSIHALLMKQKYTRARDEIMWLMLQITGSFASQITKDVCEDMASLHKLLYPDSFKSPTFDTTDPTKMYQFVRHLSTASMYILLSDKQLPDPSPYLANQISFINEKAMENPTELPLVATVANACRSEAGKKMMMSITQKLEGKEGQGEETFILPYEKVVVNNLQPLEMALIDSLSMRCKLQLVHNIGKWFYAPRQEANKMPSPAFFESYCRLLYSLEFDFGAKQFGGCISRTASSANSGQGDSFKETMYIILDMLANRLSNMPTNVHFRQTTCLTLISGIHQTGTNVQNLFSRELYSLSELVLMKEFSWMPLTEVIQFCFELLGRNKNEPRSVNAHLCHPEIFYSTNTLQDSNPRQQQTHQFHLCPEVVRMLHISLLRAAKIMNFSEEPDFFHHIGKVFKWTPKQMKSFPDAFKDVPGVMEEGTDTHMSEEILAWIHSDFTQMRGLPHSRFVEYMTMQDRKPTILCVIYRAIIETEDGNLYPAYWQILDMMNPKFITVATSWLAQYVINRIGINEDMLTLAADTLTNMVFQKFMIPFERMLMALVLHPDNDAKTKIGLSLIFSMLHSREFEERRTFYVEKIQQPKDKKPKEFFEYNAEYHKLFPEFTYQELINTQPGSAPQVNPKLHPPIYFGSLIDRLLPITDVILSRSLEMELPDVEVRTLLEVIGPIYKYHPNIFTFVYSVLHTQHEIIGHSAIGRVFVQALIALRRPEGNSSYLTIEFTKFNHQHGSFETVVEHLIHRIIECSEFTLEPPEYVEADWRTAELSAPAQALFMSCIELMASPHNAQKTIPAIISVLCKSEIVHTRPYATLNAVGQLLTALPAAYAKELHNVFVDVLVNHRVNNLSFEEIVYDNFEESVLLRITNREMTINYALQSYWHHGSHNNIGQFTQFFLNDIYDKISTEKELWYVMRLMVPLQQWVYEAKVKHLLTDAVKQAKGVMEKLGELCEKGIELEHGAEFCDVFYHLKYQCLGDSLQNEAADLLEKLPQNLRERFKYYVLSKSDDQPAAPIKMSNIIQPDINKLIKTRSNASERAP